ncbi:MAG TPA: phasin family protein [Alphaproteobacteria bacterium]|nr:phasin family protein [Alphaproteobacteria bacterium]
MTEPVEQHMEKVTQGLMKACEDINAACSESMSAMMESNAAMGRGCEEWSRNIGSLMQDSIARMMNGGRGMMNAKSLDELARMQSEIMKDCFEQGMAGIGRLSEISARVAKEAMEPVARQANAAMSKAAQHVQQIQTQGKAA